GREESTCGRNEIFARSRKRQGLRLDPGVQFDSSRFSISAFSISLVAHRSDLVLRGVERPSCEVIALGIAEPTRPRRWTSQRPKAVLTVTEVTRRRSDAQRFAHPKPPVRRRLESLFGIRDLSHGAETGERRGLSRLSIRLVPEVGPGSRRRHSGGEKLVGTQDSRYGRRARRARGAISKGGPLGVASGGPSPYAEMFDGLSARWFRARETTECHVHAAPLERDGDCVESQTAAIYARLGEFLEKHRASPSDVVWEQVFLRDVGNDRSGFEAARGIAIDRMTEAARSRDAGARGMPGVPAHLRYEPATSCLGQPPLATRHRVEALFRIHVSDAPRPPSRRVIAGASMCGCEPCDSVQAT